MLHEVASVRWHVRRDPFQRFCHLISSKVPLQKLIFFWGGGGVIRSEPPPHYVMGQIESFKSEKKSLLWVKVVHFKE